VLGVPVQPQELIISKRSSISISSLPVSKGIASASQPCRS
jgi:hypothetical protein